MLSFETYNEFEHPVVKETYAVLEQKGEHLLNTSYLWTKTWWDTFRDYEALGYDKRLYLIRVLRENKPCAMLALVRYTKTVRKSLGLISYTTLGICGDLWGATFEGFIGALSVEECHELMDYVRCSISYDQLLFSHIPVTSPLMQVIDNQVLLSACPTISLGDYADYHEYAQNTYSKKLQRNIRARKKHAINDGHELTFQSVSFSDVDFRTLKSLSISKLVSGKHSIYLDSTKARFIMCLLKYHLGNVVVVRCGEEPVAYRLNFFVGKKKYCVDASYNREFSKYGVGIMSLDASLRDTFESGQTCHCEGTGVDTYKLECLKTVIPIYVLTEPGNTRKGRLFFPIKLHRMRKRENAFENELLMLKEKYSLTIPDAKKRVQL